MNFGVYFVGRGDPTGFDVESVFFRICFWLVLGKKEGEFYTSGEIVQGKFNSIVRNFLGFGDEFLT